MIFRRGLGGGLQEVLADCPWIAPHLSEVRVTEQEVSAAVKAHRKAVPASLLLSWPLPWEPAEWGLEIKVINKADVASVFLTALPAR